MEVQRELYNAALEERRGAWRWEQRSISRFEQFRALTGWEHPVLTAGVTVFCVDVMANRREPTGKVAGIDLGVNELVATSDGQLIGNPRHLRGCLEALADRQRLVAGRKRGSQRRGKAAHQVGRLHRKITYQRRDRAHQVSRRLVNHYDLIVHENLEITNMVRRPPPCHIAVKSPANLPDMC